MNQLHKTLAILVLTGLATVTLTAQAAPASPESLNVLIEQTGLKQNLATVSKDLEAKLQQHIKTANLNLSPAQQASLDKATPKIAQAVRNELGWSQWQPFVLKTYQDSFTQDEVNQLIELYKRPGYAALAQKMQDANGKTQQIVMQRLPKIIEKVVPMIDKAISAEADKPTASNKSKSASPMPTPPIFVRP